MDCVICDFGSDIFYGYYVGWDKERECVCGLLCGVAKCFFYGCEEKGLIYGDIKPMNIVFFMEVGVVVFKLIDFDVLVCYGELCYFKYSFVFVLS